jgi:hypothetical protein
MLTSRICLENYCGGGSKFSFKGRLEQFEEAGDKDMFRILKRNTAEAIESGETDFG